MSESLAFLPSRDLRNLRTLDPSSSECLDAICSNLDSLARLLGASGGQILHAPPHLKQWDGQVDARHGPSFEHPPREVDSFEKSYITRWLTRLISEFTLVCPDDIATAARAESISDRCAGLLALAAGRMAAGASTQEHVFTLEDGPLTIKLRDGALVHDSLGTHTWGAAPILSQLLLPLDREASRDFKALELGAGTGLVGLAIAMWSRCHRSESNTQVVCTDYHPTVLENLAHNVALNGWSPSLSDQADEPNGQNGGVRLYARCLDWQAVHRAQSKDLAQTLTSQTLPSHIDSPSDSTWSTTLDVDKYAGAFDLIVAADCVYDPVHPSWLRSVAGKLLRVADAPGCAKALLHVMVPLRPTHRQEMEAVYRAFSPEEGLSCHQLVILSEQDYDGYENFGALTSVVSSTVQSQPEGGLARTYRWFQIGWKAPDLP